MKLVDFPKKEDAEINELVQGWEDIKNQLNGLDSFGFIGITKEGDLKFSLKGNVNLIYMLGMIETCKSIIIGNLHDGDTE
jgi:hypothetical protein